MGRGELFDNNVDGVPSSSTGLRNATSVVAPDVAPNIAPVVMSAQSQWFQICKYHC